MASSTDIGNETSAARELLQRHNDHHATVEDAPDEDGKDGGVVLESHGSNSGDQTMSANAAGKQKAQASSVSMDEQNFPSLGGKKMNTPVSASWGKSNGASAANGSPRTSAPTSGAATPSSTSRSGAPAISLPGRNVQSLTFEPHHILPKSAMRRPLQDVLKDLNRKSRANVTYAQGPGGKYRFDATGPQDVAQQALKELAQQIGTKQSVRVPIPASAKSHIIGRGGSTVKALQEKTGARIQLPRGEENVPNPDDDDDTTIDVIVEGNAHSAAAARDQILKIVGERTANASVKMRDIPSEFYPFIADPKRNLVTDLEGRGLQVRVPAHQPWSAQPPVLGTDGRRPVFNPSEDAHIQLAGDRAAVSAARIEIEQLVEQLRAQLAMEQLTVTKGQHKFIIGDLGTPADDFFSQTGCAVILPTDEEDDTVTVVGPADLLEAARDQVMELATQMQLSTMNISNLHRQAAGGAAAHARNVTRYLRQRKEIERLEKQYGMHINTPFTDDGISPWELYARDGKSSIQAQKEIKSIVSSHPPSRISQVAVDPFYHAHFRTDVQPRIREDFGVFLVVPEVSEGDAPVLLVYEGPETSGPAYRVPQSQPSQAEVRAFEQSIREAEKQILSLISQQEAISTESVDVPHKFHERLRRFIKKEQENRPATQIPVRVSSVGTAVTLRGPDSAMRDLAAKVRAFVEQEKEDEKERGFTMSFEFPQKFAHHLIGKEGRNIRDLREKFDVEIQVQDGQVELKGPKAKAETAKSQILSLGRQWADEATHTLKIDPNFHRELIGAQGGQISRLQTRYKVLIFFPRSAKSVRDDESVADNASEAGGKGRRNQAPDEVIIRGPKKGADEARDEILNLFQYLKDHSFTAAVPIQQKHLPMLIGQGGAAMEALRQETGARIDIPNERDSPDSMVEVQIRGTKAEVAAAKKVLEEKKAVFDDTISRTIDVDRKYHKALIGSGGSNLRELVVKAGGSDDRRELARTIQFPRQDADGSTIKLEGRKSVIENIVDQIQNFVQERDSQITEVLDVPVDKHRSLIGRGGETKKQIESRFSVSLEIPRQGSGETGVKVVGQPDNVGKAKEHIANMTKEQPSQTVQVPLKLHHVVSDGGQFFRKMRSSYHVTVDHAGQSPPPKPAPVSRAHANGTALPLITDDADQTAEGHSWDVVDNPTSSEGGEIPWVLHGSEENVAKARKAVDAAVEEAKANTSTGYLSLPDPRTYRFVIGHEGRKINSIRKQSGCKINVPHNKNNDNEAIEVQGSRDGVEKAKDLILAAVREGSKGRD